MTTPPPWWTDTRHAPQRTPGRPPPARCSPRHPERARRLIWRPAASHPSDATYVEPGVTVHGMDVGKWLQKQCQHAVWQGLMDGQRERAWSNSASCPAPGSGGDRAGHCGPGRAVQGAYGLCDGPQSPRRTAEGRNRGHARCISVAHKIEAREAHGGQAPAARRTWTGVGGVGGSGDVELDR